MPISSRQRESVRWDGVAEVATELGVLEPEKEGIGGAPEQPSQACVLNEEKLESPWLYPGKAETKLFTLFFSNLVA